MGVLAFFIFATINKTPAGPSSEIVARVESYSVAHSGVTGSTIYLVCILDNGVRVNVFLSNHEPALNVQKGQMVKLRESSRLLTSGKKYQFISYVHPKGNTQVN